MLISDFPLFHTSSPISALSPRTVKPLPRGRNPRSKESMFSLWAARQIKKKKILLNRRAKLEAMRFEDDFIL